MATRALTPDREKMTSLLKEMMRRSPDPHLPEERDRISGELSDRAFPFVVFLKKADEDQAARVTAVFTYWFEDAYDGLLENYPRSASPAEQATKEAEVRDGHERRREPGAASREDAERHAHRHGDGGRGGHEQHVLADQRGQLLSMREPEADDVRHGLWSSTPERGATVTASTNVRTHGSSA